MNKLNNFLEFVSLNQRDIFDKTIEHIGLVLVSLTISLFIGLSIGIFLTRYKKAASFVIGIVSAIQTVPSIALLGFLLPFFGIGQTPAIIALFLYALLPIIRNTYVGIEEVDSSIKEAGRGMGMSNIQLLTKVELPLAVPMMFGGIRTATVLNVGIATVSAFIGAGGLGEFIYRGIALNNTNLILIGAIPAALLAISLDLILSFVQKHINKLVKPFLLAIFIIMTFVFVVFLSTQFPRVGKPSSYSSFTAGFVPEFIERKDGYKALKKLYGLKFKTKELDSQLMFQSLRNKKVDLIAGYSTEGRIKAYNLQILEDDKNIFPSYEACPLVRGETFKKYPILKEIFSKIKGKISNEKMTELNYRAEFKKESPKLVAKSFLNELGLETSIERNGRADLIIGSKNFTEQFILAEIFAMLIENYTSLNVEIKKGLAGTKFCFDALKKGEIDIYPEYTGTGFFVVLKMDPIKYNSILRDKNKLYQYVKNKSKKMFDIEWLPPLGFNNSWVLIMRKEDTERFMIGTISDLKGYLDRKD